MHGPGDLRGQPAQLDDEKRALVYRMYEIYPPEHPEAGRRRFKRVALSLAKGLAKTEFTAWISAAELRPDARPLRRLRPATRRRSRQREFESWNDGELFCGVLGNTVCWSDSSLVSSSPEGRRVSPALSGASPSRFLTSLTT